MLRTAAPFPQIGSFALFVDTRLPSKAMQRAELVRILRVAGSMAFIAFPLRTGASGNSCVPLAELIDATPLTKAEERELADLQRALRGRARPSPAKATRSHDLAERLTWSALLLLEERKLESLTVRIDRSAGASPGSLVGSAAA